MLRTIAALRLWLCAQAIAYAATVTAAAGANVGATAEVQAVLPYNTFNAAFRLVQYCAVQRSDSWGVSDYSSEAECGTHGGKWETRPGFAEQPESVYSGPVGAQIGRTS